MGGVVLFDDVQVKRWVINGHTRYRPSCMDRGGKKDPNYQDYPVQMNKIVDVRI